MQKEIIHYPKTGCDKLLKLADLLDDEATHEYATAIRKIIMDHFSSLPEEEYLL